MRVKCLAQEHSVVPRPGLKPGPFDPESSALTMRPPRLPLLCEVTLALNVLELFAPYSLHGSMFIADYCPSPHLILLTDHCYPDLLKSQ